MADLGQAAAWHRQIAALATAADRAGVATADLPRLQGRLVAQQARFAEAAARDGAALPALVPTPSDIAAAAGALGDHSTEVVGRALDTAHRTLDAADAVLAHPGPALLPAAAPTVLAHPGPALLPAAAPTPVPAAPDAPTPTVRNGLVYGAYALCVLAIQALLFVLLDERRSLVFASPVCLLVLPVFAWLGGWLTTGFLGPPGTGRSPRLGAFICAVPDVLLCGVFGVLLIVNTAT